MLRPVGRAKLSGAILAGRLVARIAHIKISPEFFEGLGESKIFRYYALPGGTETIMEVEEDVVSGQSILLHQLALHANSPAFEAALRQLHHRYCDGLLGRCYEIHESHAS